MTELACLLADLVSGEDERAEQAAVQIPGYGAAGLAALKPLLKASQADQRWWAVRALAGFTEIAEITPDLIAALEDESEEIRQAAALALCQHPSPLALLPLIRTLSDPDPLTSRLASTALTQLGREATLPLLEVLEAGSPSARIEAAHALAENNDPRSIPGLMKALETDSAILRYWAAQGLEKLGAGMIYLKPE